MQIFIEASLTRNKNFIFKDDFMVQSISLFCIQTDKPCWSFSKIRSFIINKILEKVFYFSKEKNIEKNFLFIT